MAILTNTPFYDDDGTLIGIICVSGDVRLFQEMGVAKAGSNSSDGDSDFSRPRNIVTTKLGLDSQ